MTLQTTKISIPREWADDLSRNFCTQKPLCRPMVVYSTDPEGDIYRLKLSKTQTIVLLDYIQRLGALDFELTFHRYGGRMFVDNFRPCLRG